MPGIWRPAIAAVCCVVGITIIGHAFDSTSWPSAFRHGVAITVLFLGIRAVLGWYRDST